MADGIIQFIKLALDQASLRSLERDATAESKQIAASIARTLQGTGPEGQAILRYIEKIRATFEQHMGKIRTSVAEGLVDIPKAERQAEKLAAAFSQKLQQGIERLGTKAGMSVGGQLSTLARALPRPEELQVTRPAPSIGVGIAASELGKAGRQAASAWAENFAPIVHGVLTSDATWSVKAAALMKLGARAGDAWAEGLRAQLGTIPTIFRAAISYGTDQTLIELQKNATGYSVWQRAARGAISAVGQAYDGLRDKLRMVSVPEGEVDPMDKARLRSRFKGNNAQLNQELQKMAALSQLSGTQLTFVGRAAQMMGVNVAKASPDVQGLIKHLENLGVSGTKIGRAMPFWANGINKFGDSLVGLAKSFGLVYSGRMALEFLKGTVNIAGESEVAWAQLSTTVADYGGKLSELMPRIQPVFDEQAKLGVSYTSSAKNLARLIQITGDFTGSLRALPVVQDMAASGFMTLEQASKQVGRAMLGDLGSISRYGIFLDKNRDVLDQLSKRFGGEQAMRAQTLTGILNRMGVAWYEVKVQMGRALASDAAEGPIEKIIELVRGLKDWVDRNAMAIKFLGLLILATFTAAALVVFGFVNGLTTVFNLIGTVAVGMRALFLSIPDLAKLAFTNVELTLLKLLRDTAAYFDQLFNTELANRFDGLVLKLERRANVARKNINQNMGEARTLTGELWQGPAEPTARAPDARQNASVPHIRAREELRRRRELSDVRANVLADDTALRERGLKRLAELETEINTRMEEEKDNEKALIELGKDKATVEKIRADLEKKNNRESAADIAMRRRIERLSTVAREADDQQAMRAVDQLNQLHDELAKKRKGLGIGSDAWLKNEQNIKNVEDGINGHLQKQDTLFAQRIKRLGEMVDLDVNREDAARRLTAEYEHAETAFLAAQAIANDTLVSQKTKEDALTEAIRQRARMASIDAAMRNEAEAPSKVIDQLEKEIKIADKREKAERQLIALRDHLNKISLTGKTQQVRDIAGEQAKRITGILEGSQVDLKGVDKALTAAKELVKHGQTRHGVLKDLLKIQEELNAAAAKSNLTEEEKLRLLGQQREVAELIRKAQEPATNLSGMWQELKDIFDVGLTDMASRAGDEMANVFDVAFQGILRDARNLGTALSSIPKGLAKAMLKELHDLAQGKAKENLAWALEDTARGIFMAATGNFPGAGAAFTAAAQHTAAAAAWSLLGATAGAAGQSANAAYENSTQFASGSRGQGVDQSTVNRGPDIYIRIDGVDPKNPRHQQLVGDTARIYQERYGGRLILGGGF